MYCRPPVRCRVSALYVIRRVRANGCRNFLAVLVLASKRMPRKLGTEALSLVRLLLMDWGQYLYLQKLLVEKAHLVHDVGLTDKRALTTPAAQRNSSVKTSAASTQKNSTCRILICVTMRCGIISGKKDKSGADWIAECTRRSFGQCLTAVSMLRCRTTSSITYRFARCEWMLGVVLYSKETISTMTLFRTLLTCECPEPTLKGSRDGTHVRWPCHELTYQMRF